MKKHFTFNIFTKLLIYIRNKKNFNLNFQIMSYFNYITIISFILKEKIYKFIVNILFTYLLEYKKIKERLLR